eukprot:NODE_27561_length_509_cov_1.458115.p3 GENE.NODE_27561_length_509_cov_1.458115~~NODE_27561_length_509_cov_1.458115.p3  ORF type:complete len:66 (-),score=24.65 NODE_27561_length_509_cov_1.458115:149-346(-)
MRCGGCAPQVAAQPSMELLRGAMLRRPTPVWMGSCADRVEQRCPDRCRKKKKKKKKKNTAVCLFF